MGLGYRLLNENRNDEATAIFKRIHRSTQTLSTPGTVLAEGYAKKGEREKAIEY